MQEQKTGKKFEAHEVRQLAVSAEVDPRTAAKYLRGEQIRPMARARIERVLRRMVRP
jgi:hypothetical protein